jgi:RNA polymerase sigma-70 factor (ECF subfamily)
VIDREAERLVVACIPSLRRYARALVGNPQRADDLVQDTLERALSRLHLWRGQGDMRAWVFSIMHNLNANVVRRLQRGPAFVALAGDYHESSSTAAADAPIELREIERALHALPEKQREVLVLIAVEELSYREVAEVLKIPPGTVMSRLSRARDALRAVLRGERRASPLHRVK